MITSAIELFMDIHLIVFGAAILIEPDSRAQRTHSRRRYLGGEAKGSEYNRFTNLLGNG